MHRKAQYPFKRLTLSLLPFIATVFLSGSNSALAYPASSTLTENETSDSFDLKKSANAEVHEGEFWVCKTPIALEKEAQALPDAFKKRVWIQHYVTADPKVSIPFLEDLTGMTVQFSEDAKTRLLKCESEMLSPFQYEGNLVGLLDKVASALGLHWRWKKNAIEFYYLDTKTFYLHVLPNDNFMTPEYIFQKPNNETDLGISASDSVHGTDDIKCASSYLQLEALCAFKAQMCQEILSTIEQLLTPQVGQLAASIATGAVTVTDTPENLERIQAYLEKENETITKQVLLNIKVLAIRLHDPDQTGIDWREFAEALGEDSIDFNHRHAQLGTKPELIDNIAVVSGAFNGSKAIAKALANQAEVFTLTSPSMTTLNLRPIPVQLVKQKAYLSRVSATRYSDLDATTTTEPSFASTGISMQLLPFVMEKGDLILQYAIHLSELTGMDKAQTGQNVDLQLPQFDRCAFAQRIKLRSGQTLILSGFENIRPKDISTGWFGASLWPASETRNTTKPRELLVLLITPVILE